MKNLLFVFIIVSFFTGCLSKQNNVKIEKTFISEFLPNRSDSCYYSKNEKHDIECIGFYKKHFEYGKLNLIDSLNVNELYRTTGLKWTKLDTIDKLIDFDSILKERYLNKVIYVIEEIKSENKTNKDFLVDGDDGLQVWVNGRLIHEVHGGRYTYEEELISLPLLKGRNIIIYKIDQSYGAWLLNRYLPDKEEVKAILDKLKYEVYADLPEYCIIPDSINYITFKPYKVKNVNTLMINNISTKLTLNWKNYSNGKLNDIKKENYIDQLPELIKVPTDFTGNGVIEFIVYNNNNTKYFEEVIPIYYQSVADSLSKILVKASENIDDPIISERRNAVVDLFYLDKLDTINLKRPYSTRVKAHGLFDLNWGIENIKDRNLVFGGPTIMGYHSDTSNKNFMYRIYFPLDDDTDKPLVFFIPHILEPDKPEAQKFLHRHAGRHSEVTLWTKLTQRYKILVVQSSGQNLKNFSGTAEEELPIIVKQLKEFTRIDNSRINFFCTSSGSIITLQLLANLNFHVRTVGFSGASFNNVDENKIIASLKIIKKKYPDLLFFIRHGDSDKSYPLEKMKKIIQTIKDLGFELDFEVVKGGSHSLPYSTIAYEYFKKLDDYL